MQIHFISLGCDKNLVDSEIMLGIIKEEGYEITHEEEKADIIIINTCGFIAEANSEAVEVILKMAEYKEQGSCKSLIVTGCMVQRYKDVIFEELPEVDAIVGVGDYDSIAKVIKEVSLGHKVNLITDKNRDISEENKLKRLISSPGYFSYLKIAEGCDNYCTYCTIPSIRGKYRSRKLENILKEAEMLVKNGVKELILVAQDTAFYGKDIYEKQQLPKLLKELSKLEDLEWIRLLYCYPEHITNELIEEMANNPKVCHYIDMPIQHSNNEILKLMGRKSTEEEIVKVIEKLRKSMPDISIRTTLMVGFPGETEDYFNSMYSFVEKIHFDRLGVFEYSAEEGTPASIMKNQVDESVKLKRNKKIMLLQKNISAKISESMVGKTFRVIVDGELPDEGIYCGRSFRDCYDVDGLIFFKSDVELLGGDFVYISITKASDYDLIGEVVYESCK